MLNIIMSCAKQQKQKQKPDKQKKIVLDATQEWTKGGEKQQKQGGDSWVH